MLSCRSCLPMPIRCHEDPIPHLMGMWEYWIPYSQLWEKGAINIRVFIVFCSMYFKLRYTFRNSGEFVRDNECRIERWQGMWDMRQDIKRERTNYTYDSIIGVVHLDWDQDEQLYSYMFLRTTYRQSFACGQRIFWKYACMISQMPISRFEPITFIQQI